MLNKNIFKSTILFLQGTKDRGCCDVMLGNVLTSTYYHRKILQLLNFQIIWRDYTPLLFLWGAIV